MRRLLVLALLLVTACSAGVEGVPLENDDVQPEQYGDAGSDSDAKAPLRLHFE